MKSCVHIQAGEPLTHTVRLDVRRTTEPAQLMPNGWPEEELGFCQSCALWLHLQIEDRTTVGGIEW